MKVVKKKKKKIESPAITHNENELFHEIADKTVRSFNRVQNGKGSGRRTENIKLIHDNWDDIDWSN